MYCCERTLTKALGCWVILACVIGSGYGSRFDQLQKTTPSSSYSDAESALGGASAPTALRDGPHSSCWSNGTGITQCTCAAGFQGTPPHCRPGLDLLVLCFQGDPCGPHADCVADNGTRSCFCEDNFKGSPPGCIPDVQLQECLSSRRCGPHSECIPHLSRECHCLPGFVGEPPNCTAGPRLLARCDPYPCGPFSRCHVTDTAPLCSCLPDYTGIPPNCEPKPDMWRLCFKDRPCGYNAECRLDRRMVASCACADGAEGRPPNCVIPPREKL